MAIHCFVTVMLSYTYPHREVNEMSGFLTQKHFWHLKSSCWHAQRFYMPEVCLCSKSGHLINLPMWITKPNKASYSICLNLNFFEVF